MEAPTIENYISKVDATIEIFVFDVLLNNSADNHKVMLKRNDKVGCLGRSDWLL
jgi:hypothetical protein